MLAPSIEELVSAKIDLTEYRISRIIFKLAVEMAATMNVLAGAFEMVARTIIALLTPIWGYNVACFANPAAWVMADLFLIPAFFYCLKTVKFRLW